MTIEIMNLRDSKPTEMYDFYIDRRSPIGNPYLLEKEEDRDIICEYYEEHFYRMMFYGDNQFRFYIINMKKAYREYGKLRLFCWCAPKRCHGDTIKRFILNSKEFAKDAKAKNLKATPF